MTLIMFTPHPDPFYAGLCARCINDPCICKSDGKTRKPREDRGERDSRRAGF
jgi:hypothetical protein